MTYIVKAQFKDNIIVKEFINRFDAIEYKDIIDAHYPDNVYFTYKKRLKKHTGMGDKSKRPL